jgi:hypothetical protein
MQGLGDEAVFNEDIEIADPNTVVRSSVTFLSESDGAWPERLFQFQQQSGIDAIFEAGDFGSSVIQYPDRNGFL